MMKMSDLTQSTVLYLYSDRKHIKLDPEYQRMGDIWTVEKRQLLIDSILNGFDLPKIYLRKYTAPTSADDGRKRYSIIDGRQRLESIWKFIDGEYPLADDFSFIDDDSKKAGGLTYREFGRKFPRHKFKFDGYRLSVVVVQTDDTEIIEDIFSRLNEAVPLNAAEKRNAFGGRLPGEIRAIAKHRFFKKRLPFPNTRYRHYDLIAKFLLLEHRGALVDTKKVYLDRFVKEESEGDRIGAIRDRARKTLTAMSEVFTDRDALLRSIGSVVLYYFLFRKAIQEEWVGVVDRSTFQEFERRRRENREVAERDIGKSDYDLLEFDRYVQAPNDGYALNLRFNVMMKNMFPERWPGVPKSD